MTKNLAEELQRTARQALAGLNPTPQGEEMGGLPFRRLLAAAFRARYLLFATTLFGILVGAFLAITTANTYVSTGKFLFTASGAEASRVDLRGTTDTSQETIGTVATYILNTDNLLSQVVDKLGPERILAPYTPGSADDSMAKAFFFRVQRDWNATKKEDMTKEAALKRLKRTVNVERPRYTDVLIATCNANDPKLAQEILGTYMQEAIAFHIQQYDDPKVFTEVRTQHEQAIEGRDKAQREMRDFLDRKAGVLDFDKELIALKDDESDASAELRKLASEVAVNARLIEEIGSQIDPVKGTVPQFVFENKKADNSAELQSIAQSRLQVMRELSRLRSIGDTQAVKAKEEELKNLDDLEIDSARRASEKPPIKVEVENREWTALRDRLTECRIALGTAQTKVKQLTEARGPAATKLKKMIDLEPEYVKLREALLAAEENLKVRQSAWTEVQTKRALGQGNFSSLKEIEPATLPLEKEGPNRGKLLLGGFFVGLFLGLGVIVLRTLPDTVVRTRDDLEDIESLAVIGVMPRLDGTNLRRHVSLREQGW